jgi:hypothetical protein
VCTNIDSGEADQTSDYVQDHRYTRPQLKMVDEEQRQKKCLGCMAARKGIPFFPYTNDACFIKRKKWTIPIRYRLIVSTNNQSMKVPMTISVARGR